MIQGSQSSPKWLWTVELGGLTGREEVVMTSAFLSEGLLLQALHVFAMFLMEHHGLGGFTGSSLTNGVGTGSLNFLD